MKRKEDKRREAIVEEYLAGETSYRELELKYGIGSSTVQRWVKARGDKTGSGRETEGKDVSSEAGSGEAEIKRLRSELRSSELHNKLLNAMIDIAEEQLGVKIRKKPGARQ